MNVEDFKHCPKCDNVFPKDTGFHPNAGRSDGLSVYCRKCLNAVNNTGTPLITRNNTYQVKKCSGCKLVFDISHFRKAPRNFIEHLAGEPYSQGCEACALVVARAIGRTLALEALCDWGRAYALHVRPVQS